MAILTFPSIFPTRVKWGLQANTQIFSSPFTKSVQTLEKPGSLWQADLSFRGLNETQIRPLIAFMAQLRGRAGRFFLHDHGHPLPNGTITGSPIISGASQTGTSVLISGFTGTLLAGDYIGLPIFWTDGSAATELKFVTADVTGTGGAIAVSIEPAIRVSPRSGIAVVTNQPTAVMRLVDDKQLSYGRGGSPIYDMSLSAIEAF